VAGYQPSKTLAPWALSPQGILARLWELANLSHEVTRGTIAGQIKALSMIVAIEGLIPDRRVSTSQTQPAAPPVKAEIYTAEWLRKQQQGKDTGDTVAPKEAQPAAIQVPEPQPILPPEQNHIVANPFVIPDGRMRVPDATGSPSMLLWTRPCPSGCPFL
jgi:hypothetical protein